VPCNRVVPAESFHPCIAVTTMHCPSSQTFRSDGCQVIMIPCNGMEQIDDPSPGSRHDERERENLQGWHSGKPGNDQMRGAVFAKGSCRRVAFMIHPRFR
jgi:hypothetical protein